MALSRYTAVAIGACVLVIGTMVIGVGGASAAQWRLNGTIVGSLIPEMDGELTFNQGSLLSTILGIQTEIRCTLLELGFFAQLEKEGKVSSLKGKFTGCTVRLNGELSECFPHSSGKAVGTIETLSLKGSLGLNLGAGVVTITPASGSTLVVVEMGAACPIGTKVPISGTLVAEDAGIETEAVEHQFKESFSFSSLTALGNSAKLDSTVSIYPIFSHAGMKWSGLRE